MAVHLTDRELDVMSILWETGGSTVAEVREQLGEDLAYTSVLSVLRLLEQKGHVAHEKEGRAFRYRALVPAEEAGRPVLHRLMAKLYENSPVKLLAQLVSDRDLTEDELRRMRELLNAPEEGPS